MTAVVDELGLTALATSITGLSVVGAPAILAETGDLRRFATGGALARQESGARSYLAHAWAVQEWRRMRDRR